MLGKYATFGSKSLYYLEWNEDAQETVVYLPGWLAAFDTYPYTKIFNKNFSEKNHGYHYIVLGLSNTYKSGYSDVPMSLDDYADEIKQFLEYKKIKQIHIIGHSAGGRFTLYFAHKYPEFVRKIVLCDSAGLNHKPASEKMLKRVQFFFTKFIVNKEQKKLLKETFIQVYNASIEEKIQEIHHDALIVWGEQDTTIAVKKAHILHSLLTNSTLKIYPSMNHMTVLYTAVHEDIFGFLKQYED